DACEGYNPTHDACRLIINAAVAMARGRQNRNIGNFEFSVVARPNGRVAPRATEPLMVKLDDRVFTEKLAAARHYPELSADVNELVKKYSEKSFRTEFLYPVLNGFESASGDRESPYYEKHGETRVREGHY